MARKEEDAVRAHLQERAWLLLLGKGDIFKGVQNLLEKEANDKANERNKNKKDRT